MRAAWTILVVVAAVALRAEGPASPAAKPVVTASAPAPASTNAPSVRITLEPPGSALGPVNETAVRDRLRRLRLERAPEDSGSAGRHLREKRGWRGIADLFNPMAPASPDREYRRPADEPRRLLDHGLPDSVRAGGNPAVPRSFRDPITQEQGVRLW